MVRRKIRLAEVVLSVGLGVAACTGLARGQTGFSITGGLSNFDCTNHCDEPCDEFEIEIEGIEPRDVVHTYHNANYGSPTITAGPAGGSTIIDYRGPQHLTAVGAVEHFGISLAGLGAANPIHVRWMRSGRAATVNGQIPTPTGTAPATQPIMPSISADLGVGGDGAGGVACTVTNNDASQSIWVRRRAKVMRGRVTLEALMPSDPIVTTTVPLDASWVLLGPGESSTISNDLVEIEDDQSVIFAAEYAQDLTGSGLFGQGQHSVGPVLGNVMTATIASPETGCDQLRPVIVVQPADVTAAPGRTVTLQIDVEAGDIPATYQWLREGVPVANGHGYSGATRDELSIDELTAANEGLYACRVSNACGTVVSQSALVYLVGHNAPPPRAAPCAADYDGRNGVDLLDVFAFLDDWFNGAAAADFDGVGGVDVLDIFAFLAAWFGGCP